MTDVGRTIDAVWRLESARIVAGLTRMLGDVGPAEEVAQDALVAALEQWTTGGVPANPGAWLTTVAKRRAVDHLRRTARTERVSEQLAREAAPGTEGDDVLRLIFVTCHPVLPPEGRLALTLRLVCGLTPDEIARAFLTGEPTIAARLAAAKRTLAQEHVPFEVPAGTERLRSVLDVVYLVFNEGYAATSGDDLIRPGLCLEALRLARLLAELVPDEPEVHGLVALLEIQESRSAARTGPSGEPVPLHEQNRGLWDPLLIRRGFTAMLRARALGGPPGPYVLQAAIAVCHAQAPTADDTDWPQIAALYEALARIAPSPVVRLNQAVAVGRAHGAQAGLDLIEPLTGEPRLRDYHLLPAVRADLLLRLDRTAEARREFERAAALTRNAAEREFLLRRATSIAGPVPTGPTLGAVADEFLAGLGATTRHSYGQTLRRLCRALGSTSPLATLTADAVAGVFALAWDTAAPATWNRHRAAVRSFGAFAGVPDLDGGVPVRDNTAAPIEPLDAAVLEALWSLPHVPLRERTLWRLVHESAAPVRTVLGLDVPTLDLDDRRARSGAGWVSWRSGTAALLPRLIGERTGGPLFVASRGGRRLSYERAEYLFKQATRPLDPDGTGFTLRRLRPRK